MTAELGHFALILALFVALAQSVVPMVGAQKGWHSWMQSAVPAAQVQFLLVLVSFVCLTIAFVASDFSVALVVSNSHSAKPMLYKISGVWGNHEGSLLLWVLILTLFGALVSWFGGNLPPALKARVLSVQGMIGLAFLSFILFTSNPFLRLEFPPLDGNDLNPLLQDPGLAFHPPFLYLGYVGLSVTFAFAIAALIDGRIDAAWAAWVRPWALVAWVTLTIGIALGSWWAYYELGWGGWWFWDPVENASFMPWLISAALLHSAIVVEKRDTLKSWTILLAILAFSFSLIGTFIVRSGVITSVHAFASDPTRGVYILGILVVAIGGAMTLYVWRAAELKSTSVFGIVSRESALVVNNLLLTASCAVVFVGTIWPLVAEAATGAKVSVGPPFFDTAFTPFMIILAMLLPLGAIMPWKRANMARSMKPLWGVLALSLALGALVWSMQTGGRMLAPIGITLAVWVVVGAFADLLFKARLGKAGAAEVLRRLGNLPRAEWGKAFAHTGFGLVMFGIAAITAWEVEDIRTINVGETYEMSGYTLRLDDVDVIEGPNYRSQMGMFSLLDDAGGVQAVLTPEKRFYPVQRMPTTEAAIDQGWTRDIYVTLGDAQADGSWAVRSYVKPFANWIWIGSIVMGLGGLISLTDRRYRVATLAARKRTSGAVPAE